MSRSYGQNIPSLLQIFKYSDEIKDYTNDDVVSDIVRFSPMLEQIVCNNDKLYMLYESNSNIYNCKQKDDFDSVPVIDADDLVKRLENKK